MVEDPTAITLPINYTSFIKLSYALLLWLKMGFQDHKAALPPQKRPNLAKKSKIAPKSSLSALMGNATALTWATNHFIFI